MSKTHLRPVAEKPAPASVTKSVPMRFKKSTPGTHVYETDADDALCTQVYLKKGPMGATGEPPQHITLSVTYTA
jgi:hypothetical protein